MRHNYECVKQKEEVMTYYDMLIKLAQENYNKSRARKKKKDESFIMYLIQNMLSATVKTALDEIFKSMKL